MLFVSLDAVITLLAKPLITFAYGSDILLGDIQLVSTFTFPTYGVNADSIELIICFCAST